MITKQYFTDLGIMMQFCLSKQVSGLFQIGLFVTYDQDKGNINCLKVTTVFSPTCIEKYVYR